MRQPQRYTSWLITGSSPEEAQALRSWLSSRIDLDRGLTDTVRTYPAGVEQVHSKPHRLGDYFADIEAAAVSGVMLVLSNLVSNVPAVLLWAPVVPQLADAHEVWLLLAMSSTFAGNLLLIGSMANLIVAERAAARGEPIGFGEYARAGVPLALLSIMWGTVVLLVVA